MTKTVSKMSLKNTRQVPTTLESSQFSSSSESTGSTVVVTPVRGSSPVLLEVPSSVTPRPSALTISGKPAGVEDVFMSRESIARGLLSDFDYATFMMFHSKGKEASGERPLTEVEKQNRMRTVCESAHCLLRISLPSYLGDTAFHGN